MADDARLTWSAAISALDEEVTRVFTELDTACGASERALDLRPAGDGWTSREVLEHVHLTNHFLGILIDKIAARCARRLENGAPWPDGPPRFEHLERIARREHRWQHPVHMTPHGDRTASDIASDLAQDARRCHAWLAAMPSGEGTLHRIRMSVIEGDDRLDLYQYIRIVVLHGARHLAQLERNRDEQ